MRILILLLLTGCGTLSPQEVIHYSVNDGAYVNNSCLQIAKDKAARLALVSDSVRIATGVPYDSFRPHAVVVADGLVYDVKGAPFPESELYLLGEFQ